MSHQKRQRLGLIGKDISYSLSPTIHLSAAGLLSLDVDYELIDLPTKQSVLEFAQRAWNDDYIGFNVTQPWKNVFGTKGCNTLYRNFSSDSQLNHQWLTASTDGEGLRRALGRDHVNAREVRRIICLGNGGVVEAIASSFPSVKKIDCLTRRELNPTATTTRNLYPWDPAELKKLLEAEHAGVTLLIQATPLPFHGDAMSRFGNAVLAASIKSQTVVVDLCYGVKSDIVGAARSIGLCAQDGLTMLIEQARLSQTIWWGKSAPFEQLFEACCEKLRASNPS